jgi:hypothetical protein
MAISHANSVSNQIGEDLFNAVMTRNRVPVPSCGVLYIRSLSTSIAYETGWKGAGLGSLH